jgi:hypothetical protein
MTKDFQTIYGYLEPAATVLPDAMPSLQIEASIAISLKRIADVLNLQCDEVSFIARLIGAFSANGDGFIRVQEG